MLPPNVFGWVLFVIFTPVTLYVAYWRFHKRELPILYYVKVAIVWTLIAVIFDYIFIVKLFGTQSYYSSDVLLYYVTTFIIPVVIGFKYSRKKDVSPSTGQKTA